MSILIEVSKKQNYFLTKYEKFDIIFVLFVKVVFLCVCWLLFGTLYDIGAVEVYALIFDRYVEGNDSAHYHPHSLSFWRFQCLD